MVLVFARDGEPALRRVVSFPAGGNPRFCNGGFAFVEIGSLVPQINDDLRLAAMVVGDVGNDEVRDGAASGENDKRGKGEGKTKDSGHKQKEVRRKGRHSLKQKPFPATRPKTEIGLAAKKRKKRKSREWGCLNTRTDACLLFCASCAFLRRFPLWHLELSERGKKMSDFLIDLLGTGNRLRNLLPQ